MRKYLAAAVLSCLSSSLLASSPFVITPPVVDVSACVASAPNGFYGWNGTCGCTTEGIVSPKFAERRSVDGDVMVLASPNSPTACTGSGSIFVYRKTGSEWLLETELLSPLRLFRDFFPGKVIVKGNTIVARPTYGAHATAIFKFNGSEWLAHQTISAEPTESEQVNWSFDGTTLSIMGYNEQNDPRIRFFTPASDGMWRQSSELTKSIDLPNHIRGGNHALSGDTLVTREIQRIDGTNTDATYRTHQLVFKLKDSEWIEESRFFIDSTFLSLGEFDPAPAVSTDEIIFRPFKLVRDTNGNWQRQTIEQDFPTGSYNLSPNGNILIVNSPPLSNSTTFEIRTYRLSDNNKWELVDEISEPALTGNETRYTVNDGSTLLRRERVRTESNALEVRVFAYSFDENGNFIDAGQSQNSSGTCDYSSANLYDGWGWNLTTQLSCPPVVTANTNTCVDWDGDGWGWDGTDSCQVAPVAPVPPTVTQSACIDTDGDGWGWNGAESCRVTPAAPIATSSACIDDDGDGWGWDGVMSCVVQAPVTQPDTLCIDSDGDGWGWDGVSSCRVD